MSLLEFYDMSKENILYSLIIFGSVYIILSSFLKKEDSNYNLPISAFIGISFTVIYSFITFPSDKLDTSNFWG